MKKYLGVGIALFVILSMGSASAIVFQTSSLNFDKSLLLVGTLDGGHGGGCHNTNITNITGVLAYDGNNFTIGTVILHFGCASYLNQTSPYDFDGDGTIETRLNEVLGLVGTSITVGGNLRCQNTRFIVFYINGHAWRDCTQNKY